MKIDRKELLKLHDPVHNEIDITSPLTVGNGQIAFTADVTGFQSLYNEYGKVLPLCTMSQWGWHTKPVSDERYSYSLNDVIMDEYDFNGRIVKYPRTRFEGNEEVFDWLRMNPHRVNLARIGLWFDGREIVTEDLSEIEQELDLYQGIIYSRYSLGGNLCNVMTCCDCDSDRIAFSIKSELLGRKIEIDGRMYPRLEVRIEFPYGAANITGSDWDKPNLHITEMEECGKEGFLIRRTVDKDRYFARFETEQQASVERQGHTVRVSVEDNELTFNIQFADKEESLQTPETDVFESSREYWREFWEKGGIIRLNRSCDKRAFELERRIILSIYLLAVNSCGMAPPQETGLTCNSWYGKMHLEMHPWHVGWCPLWNHSELAERSLGWYLKHLPQARDNAAANGYAGARWPKMVADEGVDCPSKIAPLLVWQQPHIIYMLELIRRNGKDIDFISEYWPLVIETAEFMVDYVVYNKEHDVYEIVAPVIPVQERHLPEDTKNPAFEVEYWRYALGIALEWAELINNVKDENESVTVESADKWAGIAQKCRLVHDKLVRMPISNGLFVTQENCPDMFEKVAIDHPSMLQAFGMLPNEIDEKIMQDTLDAVLEKWDYNTLWGWDFAVIAMTAVRLGCTEVALSQLLLDTPKNQFVRSGNNRQVLRDDLPIYLPGNGGLLLAIAMMAAGYDGCDTAVPGFPDNGEWIVESEGLKRYI